MYIRITDWGSCFFESIEHDSDIGLLFAGDKSNMNSYKVIDKPLFMLAVIKHGIKFKKLQ